jgi:transposase-like protein
VKLVISDAHEGLKAAVTRVLRATTQRCRVHFARNALAHAGKSQRRIVSPGSARLRRAGRRGRQAAVAHRCRPAPAEGAQARGPDGQRRGGRPGLHGVPGRPPDKLHSTNPIERLNGEIKRRTNTVGIFPNEAAVVRLVGALLLEQSDEWATQRARYMTLEAISAISDTGPARLSAVPA